MLPRILQRSPRIQRVVDASSTCPACTCQCGRTFWNPINVPNAMPSPRHLQTRRKAPSTIRSEREMRARSVDQVAQPNGRRQAQSGHSRLEALLQSLAARKLILVSVQQSLDFYAVFQNILDRSSSAPAADVSSFRKAQKDNGLNDEDCLIIAQAMLQALKEDQFINHSIKLVNTLSRAGYIPATLWIMGNTWALAKTDLAELHSPKIRYSDQHLRELAADEEGDYRAKTLLGRIEQLQGNEDNAIALWTKAVDAVSKSERRISHPTPRMDLMSPKDQFFLETPYVELALIHRKRSGRGKGEMDACWKALDVGCRQDDAWAFFTKAMLSQNKNIRSQNGDNKTSQWLYNMTKAAISGHARAMYELAVFYRESGWKYLANEPPDHVKPTPFDSYPASTKTSISDRLATFLGFGESYTSSTEDDIFRTAAYPNTTVDRYRIAMEWARLAHQRGFAPAAVFLATISLQESIPNIADAPTSAINLHNSRYSFSSKAEYDVRGAIGYRINEEESMSHDRPNPFYNPENAKSSLRDFFEARHAHHLQAKPARHDAEARQSRHFDSDIGFGDDWTGVVADAERLCDELGFNIYSTNNELLYRCKSIRKGSGSAISAKPAAAVAAHAD